MSDQIKIIVNNKAYSEIKEINIVSDLDYLSSSFECAMSNRFIARSPIAIEDQIQIQIGSDNVLYGFVEGLSSNITNGSHDFIISGSSQTADIEMSEISVNATYTFKKMKALCEKLLSDNGINYISVIDNSYNPLIESGGVFTRRENDFPNNDAQSGETGQTLFDFLAGYAEKSGRVLTTNGDGDLVIYNNSGVGQGIVLNNSLDGTNETIIQASFRQDITNRYQKVIVKSQSADLESGGDDITGEAEDSVIRRNVNKVIIADSVTDGEITKQIAQFEVNKRRSDSVQYNCTVHGFYADNGTLWQPNLLVSVIDENFSIKATMLLKRVAYKYDQSNGSTCDLTFVSEDAFSLKTKASALNEGVN